MSGDGAEEAEVEQGHEENEKRDEHGGPSRGGTTHHCRGPGPVRTAYPCPEVADSTPRQRLPPEQDGHLTSVQGVRRGLACLVRPMTPAASITSRAPSRAHLAHQCRNLPRH